MTDKSKIVSWKLSFSDIHLEKEYTDSKYSYQYSFYRGFAHCAALFLLAGHFSDPFNIGIWAPLRILVTAGNIVFLYFPLVIFKKFPKKIEFFICICLQLLTLAFLEATLVNKDRLTFSYFFVIGNLYNTLFLCPLVSKISWQYTLFSSIITTCHCHIRYIKASENPALNFFPLVNGLLFALLIPLISYLMEKYDRAIFSQKKNYENSLNCFKDLIKDVLPNSVLVCNDGKIIYSNSQANRFFHTDNNEILLEHCKKVFMRRKTKKQAISTLGPSDSQDNSVSVPISLFHSKENIFCRSKEREDSVKLISSMFQLISNPHIDKIKENNYQVYSGKIELEMLNESHQNLMDKLSPPPGILYLEIKASTIFWDSKQALILFISEDTHLQKLHLLKEKNQYKDQLLATVSHDLRTPLNGIIRLNKHRFGRDKRLKR